MEKKLRAVAYCRVSTAMQEEGRSLEFQIKKCQEFSKFKEYKLLDIIEDVESGGKDDRPGFNRLIEKVRNKEFDILVVYETSRISRVTITMLNFVLDLQRSGIHFLSISQPELNTTTPTGMLFFQIQASLSEYERKQISVRVKSNKWARAKEGIWQGGKLPIGYKREKEKVVVDPEDAKIVKEMFAYYLTSESLKKTAKLFNRHIESVRWILTNDFYIGKFRYGKKENNIDTGETVVHDDYQYFEGKHEPIISEKTFNKVKKALSTNRRTRSQLLFTGLVVCDKCGHKFYSHPNGDMQIYRCGKCGKSMTAKKLEKGVLEELFFLSELEELNVVDNDTSETEKRIKLLNSLLEKLKKEEEKVKKLYIRGYISEKELDEEIINLTKNKVEIKNEVRELQDSVNKILSQERKINNVKVLREVLESVNSKDIADMRKIFQLLIEKIYILNRKPLEISIILKKDKK